MITLKTAEEIDKMREGGRILAEILERVKKEVKVGVSTAELDRLADDLIVKAGAQACFKKVRDYKWATCMCVNETVVHGIPGEYRLQENDLLGIDMGILYKGFHTDMAESVLVSTEAASETNVTNSPNSRLQFLEVGREALRKAILEARVGSRVGHISQAIQETIEAAGFSPVQALVGHGIGRSLHEDPQIPCFLKEEIEKTPLIKAGMTFAIEVIYNQGEPEVVYQNDDDWTIQTADGKLSGLFEKTIAILPKGPEILTKVD